MSEQKFLAHIAADGREQTVQAHLMGTAQLAAAFARSFGAEEQGELAGLAHDLGKYSADFQRRIRGSSESVDHVTAGAFECMRRGQPLAAFAVAGHHGGLPDGGSRGDSPEASTFWGRMNRAMQSKLPPCDAWQSELTLPPAAVPDSAAADKLSGMFFTRMLFSCLVDADWSDTGEFMAGTAREAGAGPSMELLWERLQAHISNWFPPQGELNVKRCAILERCIREGQERGPGLYTLTVPTGGGKTTASLAFALAQAKACGLRRVVYVIPYTSIIEQTADTFRKILGPEAVLEHHSGVLFDEEQEATAESIRLTAAAETWDVPVVVTTAVQFFESLYACRPSQCRKLHSLAESVIIFDEAQMLPLPYLRPCVWAIAQLVRHFGASAVLCTATQPALSPLFREFAPNMPVMELCPMEPGDWDAFRRVTFRRVGQLTWADATEQLQAREQVLCVVNSRAAAQEVYRRLAGEGSFHLSTLMYPAHRKAVLAEIRQRLKAGLPCRVVSTSLIEAGVDVDFPAVWREEAGLDSILQAAGRCNREGDRPAADSVVTIFRGETAPSPLFATAIGAGRLALDKYSDIASREAVHAYFSTLLDLKGEKAQDKEGILPLMETEFFPFRTVAERFHLINAPTVTVYIPDGAGAALAERLRAGARSRALYRRLGQYGVSIYEQDFAALDRSGALERLEDGSVLLTDLSLYSEKTGLSIKADSGKGLFI